MDVLFRNRRLARCYEEPAEAVRRWGPAVGHRYVTVVDLLHEAPSVTTLFAVRSLDLHPLTGDLRGLHAMRLSGRYRLILEIRGEVVTVQDVVDYHG